MLLEGVTKKQYQSAAPYPHVVIDDFLDTELAITLSEKFPSSTQRQWVRFSNEREKKLAYSDVYNLGDDTDLFRSAIAKMESRDFLDRLAQLVDVDELHTDHTYLGGGLHRIERDGHLALHSDFNFHPRLRKKRKVNLLLFLNRDWKQEWGGHLELWKRDMSECAKKITPIFNRCVIFTTESDSWHGHPHPLTCPEGVARKSIALYYYTDEHIEYTHGTIFRKPTEDGYRNVQTI